MKKMLCLLYNLSLVSLSANLYAAELILINGTIHTMTSDRILAEGIAVSDGRIIAVGSNDDIQQLVEEDTQVIDLQGLSLFPGFTDAHSHPASGGSTLLELSFTDKDDAAGVQNKLRSYVAAHPEKIVITGGGWSLTRFADGNPHKAVLDAVVSDRPVILTDSNHHSVWVNSAALLAAGIDRDTADPVNGSIERDPVSGVPTGTLRESAQNLVSHLVAPVSLQQQMSRLQAGIRHLNKMGYTALVDANVESSLDAAWLGLADSGDLNARVTLALRPAVLPLHAERDIRLIPKALEELERRRRTLERAGYDAGQVKIFLDGGLESCTAAFLEFYAAAGCGEGHRGSLNFPPEFLDQYVARLQASDFRVHFHAIGDLATRTALNSFDRSPTRTSGNTISHLQFVHPDDHLRFNPLNVFASIQALWAFPYDQSMTPFENTAIGRWRYPFRSLHDAGARLVSGSDWPVSTADPFHAMEVAVLRQNQLDTGGPKLLPEQAISVDDFLEALTINGARLLSQENERGTIEPGKLADIVVISANPYQIEPEHLSDIRIQLTMLAGRTLYRR